ncbi:MAG: DUF2288 domain-containing protein [Cellvibrionaceae bacterium]|nr:DUF2288 domain-containing protein [Cellvibrionaceae bacterium]
MTNHKALIDDPDFQKLMGEAGLIRWSELLPFFAAGDVINIDNRLDMVVVAYHLLKDNKTQFEHWTGASLVHPVTDTQAKNWLDNNSSLWALVVKPWVLVQEQDNS